MKEDEKRKVKQWENLLGLKTTKRRKRKTGIKKIGYREKITKGRKRN